MAVKLLCLCLPLLALLAPSWATETACLSSASNCSECIQAGPECAWCKDHHSKMYCHTVKELRKAGCRNKHIYNPQGGVQVVKNDSRTEPAEIVFLQPREVSIHLRPGVSQSFPLTVAQAAEQPVTDLTLDTSPLPEGVNITFSSIMNGNPRVIQVHVEAAQCLSEGDNQKNSTGPWSIQITPRGFSLSLKLELTLECQCDCTRDRVENSPACRGHGALVCGQCECAEPYIGRRCDRLSDLFSSPEDDRCHSRPRDPVCSGRGRCVDGFCECDSRINPQERYTGMFCECNNFYCLRHNNRLCGGHGRCECGQCVCDNGWAGDDCSCSMETASCLATNQQLCNGRGTCQCGECKCEPPYTGSTCERLSDLFSSREDDLCRSGPRAAVCSGNGKCVDGSCECDRRINPQERYTGKFCQCSNFDCPRHNNRLCGGHGRCECGQCICDNGWAGEDCSCSMETASCLATNQQLCNGRGVCQCGKCKCEPPYMGPTCESCPVCLGTCPQHQDCVECRAFGTGRKKDRCDTECAYLNVTMMETDADLPRPGETPVTLCKMRSSDDFCLYAYALSTTPSGGTSAAVRAKECPRQ